MMTTNAHKTMQFVEKRFLRKRYAVESAPSVPVHGTLLVSTRPVLTFIDNETQFGEDYIDIFAAFHNGSRCWLRRATWSPAPRYSGEGVEEEILSFEEGVRLFLEHGVFQFDQFDQGE